MAQNTTVLHRDEVTSLNYLVETTSLPTMRVLNRILLNRCAPRHFAEKRHDPMSPYVLVAHTLRPVLRMQITWQAPRRPAATQRAAIDSDEGANEV